MLLCDADDQVGVRWVAEMVSALGRADVVGGRIEETRPAQWRGPLTPEGLPMALDTRPYAVVHYRNKTGLAAIRQAYCWGRGTARIARRRTVGRDVGVGPVGVGHLLIGDSGRRRVKGVLRQPLRGLAYLTGLGCGLLAAPTAAR